MAMTQLHDDSVTNATSMNKQRTIRIMVLGEEKVGKSSLISALVSQQASERVPSVLHDIVIPTEDTRENVAISLHDTSSSSNDVMEVIKTMNRSDAAIVVFDVSRSISSQRLGYWLDLLKVTKVMPVVLVGNKCDLLPGGSEISRVQSVLRNYKFIVHSLECSARTLINVKKTFGLAQKAVLYPMAPLYDAEKKNVCFKTRMKPEDMDALLELVALVKVEGVATDTRGLRFDGFAYLSELAIEKNKPEHCWQVLRTIGYSDTLELELPHDLMDVPRDSNAAQYEMCELSAAAIQFLTAVFTQFAPLTQASIDDIFAIVPPPKRPTYSFLSPEPLAVSYPERDAKPADAYAHLLHNVHTVVDKETGAQRTLIVRRFDHDGAVPFTMQKAAAKKRNDRLFYGGLVAVAAVAAGVGYAYADELKELSVVQSLVRLWDQSKLHLVPKLKQ
ncbi:hypothetical protein DYB25_003402 [Aphanomyces astaci]|uniref:EF hand associated type-2 domain-containing protein n=1 Tax=Aphanomyces astaci TaxID=112090 RepID=A0A397CCE5_APHAT|nr:hypothetical protein DYB25_003402 [Aphanomyces astaci]RHY43741.1 hypothetical protein DYB38_005980 [Aphanomyces astaci]